MTKHPCTHVRSTRRLLRGLDQRLDIIDQKLEYVIWKLPDSFGTVRYDHPSREPADSLQYDPTDRFKWEND